MLSGTEVICEDCGHRWNLPSGEFKGKCPLCGSVNVKAEKYFGNFPMPDEFPIPNDDWNNGGVF